MYEGDFVKGYNEINLGKHEFKGAGVLYYELETPSHTATRKMLRIE